MFLVGGSGCGKTTTLKMVNRLVEPTTGRVRVDGRDTCDLEPHALRRGIGYVFQQVGLFPHLSVARNVAITLSLLGAPQPEQDARADELLMLVGLPPAEYRDRMPHQLSGGQQQRVGIARALAARPGLMLLDEPFGALDPVTRDRLQQSFQDIRRELGFTSIFVSHDMVEALLLADRIAVMDGGRIIQVGTPRELLVHPDGPAVSALMETPRRHTAVVDALLAEAGA